MIEKCHECGRRFRKIHRQQYEEDDLGRWVVVPVRKSCWSGVVLVEDDFAEDELVCGGCGQKDCAASEAMLADWREGVEAAVKEDYQSASVRFLPAYQHATEIKAHWTPGGYEDARRRHYEAGYDNVAFGMAECDSEEDADDGEE